MNVMIIIGSRGLNFVQFNVRGWLLAAHTEKQTLQAGPFETCSQQPKDARFGRPGERHVRDSPTIEMVFISMYDPFSDDDNDDLDTRASQSAEEDGRGRKLGCGV